MGELPTDLHRTAEVLTRLATAGDRLGIDLSHLQPRLPALGSAAGDARISLDSAGRLAIRVPQDETGPGSPLPRPGADARFLELEVIPGQPDLGERAIAVGRRAFADDRELLIAAKVEPAVCDQVGIAIDRIGVGASMCDGLAWYSGPDGERWTATVAHELTDVGDAPTDELVAMIAKLTTMLTALDVHPAQRRIFEQAHTVLAPGHGFTVAWTFERTRVWPAVSVAYRDVAWKRVVGLLDTLRPATPSGPPLGVLAGAFAAPHASELTLTFAPGVVAYARTSVELGA